MSVVVITRPAAQAVALAERVALAGFEPLIFPAIAIDPVLNAGPLQNALARLDHYRLVIFVSPNAIEQALKNLDRPWPVSVPVGVMGRGSVDALTQYGICRPTYRIHAPGLALPADAPSSSEIRFDSEALLQQLNIDALHGAKVLIVKGNGGRPWLAERLIELGVQVEQVESYRRSRHRPDASQRAALQALMQQEQKPTWIVTSSEAIHYLFESLHEIGNELCGESGGESAVDWLRACRWLVPHRRIAENATAAGVRTLVLSGAGDVQMVQALR